MAANVVIRMGLKRSNDASKIASSGDLPRSRSASRAKSTIMIAFFLTMPISRTMPMMPITSRSLPAIISASNAPMPAEGNVDRIVTGMNEALVQHAQHDVDGDEGGDQQEDLARQGILESLGGTLKALVIDGGKCTAWIAWLMSSTAVLSDAPSVRLKDTVTAGNCAR